MEAPQLEEEGMDEDEGMRSGDSEEEEGFRWRK